MNSLIRQLHLDVIFAAVVLYIVFKASFHVGVMLRLSLHFLPTFRVDESNWQKKYGRTTKSKTCN